MQRDEILQAVQDYYRLIAEGSREQVLSAVAPQFRHNIAGLPEGFNAWWSMVESFRTGFTAITHAVDDVLVEECRSAVRITTSGIHNGMFLGHPPSGRFFRSGGIELLRFEGRLVAERWGSFDVVSMLRQLHLYVEARGPQ